MTFMQSQAGPSSCGQCEGYTHALSQTCAFLPCCWLVGAQKHPLGGWDVRSSGQHPLCAPSQSAVTELACGGSVCSGCFPTGALQCSSTAAPGCTQCCGGQDRLESQPSPTQAAQTCPGGLPRTPDVTCPEQM